MDTSSISFVFSNKLCSPGKGFTVHRIVKIEQWEPGNCILLLNIVFLFCTNVPSTSTYRYRYINLQASEKQIKKVLLFNVASLLVYVRQHF